MEITTIELESDLFMLMGQGGNIGLSVGDDGAFLIDDQFAPLTEKILAAVAAVTDQPVRWVLNTHWHGDHTGGNENLGTAGAMIVAHENVYRRMNPAEFAELVGRSDQAPRAGSARRHLRRGGALPLERAPHRGHARRRVAHTDGDAIVHFPRANVFHMGDTFFRGRYPFIDVDSGGGVDGVIAAANFVLERSSEGTRIIPGHGELASPEHLREYQGHAGDGAAAGGGAGGERADGGPGRGCGRRRRIWMRSGGRIRSGLCGRCIGVWRGRVRVAAPGFNQRKSNV